MESKFNTLWKGVYELMLWKEEYEDKLDKNIKIDYGKYEKMRTLYEKERIRLVDLLDMINMRNPGVVKCMSPMTPPPPPPRKQSK